MIRVGVLGSRGRMGREVRQAVADGRVGPGERAVLFNCATGLKYPMPEAGIRLKLGEPVDWRQMQQAAAAS